MYPLWLQILIESNLWHMVQLSILYVFSYFGRIIHEMWVTASWNYHSPALFVCQGILLPIFFIIAGTSNMFYLLQGLFKGSIDKVFYTRFNKRYSCPETKSNRCIFWSKMRSFLEASDNKKDTIRRLCCINLEIFNFDHYDLLKDSKFRDLLEMNENALFHEITDYADLRGCSKTNVCCSWIEIYFPFWIEMISWSKCKYRQYWQCKSCFKLIPLSLYCLLQIIVSALESIYYLSRIVYLIWPFVGIYMYLISDDAIWRYSDDDFELMIMYLFLIFSAILTVIVSIGIYKELRTSFLLYHILPNETIPPIIDEEMVEIHEQRILFHYQEIKDIPLRERFIIEHFGEDVGFIINEFNGRFGGDNDIGQRLWIRDKETDNEWKAVRIMDKTPGHVLFRFIGVYDTEDLWISADFRMKYEISMTPPKL